MIDPKTLNNEALSILKKMTEGCDLELEEILKKPPYFGWVQLGDFPRYIYLNGQDDGVALKWLWNRKYEYASIMAWRSLSDHADCIFDVGAHTGSYSLIASLNERARVYSFEPMPMNLARLVMNLQYNKTNNIRIFKEAVSNSTSKVFMDLFGSVGFLTSGKSISYDSSDKRKDKIDSIKLDDALAKINSEGQLLVKIDVEGLESDVLLGSDQLLNRRSVLIMECIDGESGQRCTEILSAQNYYFYLIDEKLETITQVDSIKPELVDEKPIKSRLNRLILPREKAEKFLKIARSGLAGGFNRSK